MRDEIAEVNTREREAQKDDEAEEEQVERYYAESPPRAARLREARSIVTSGLPVPPVRSCAGPGSVPQ